MFKNLTKAEKSWVLYDVGNSAFTMLACSLIPIWFKALAIGDSPGQITGDQATAYYSIAIAVVTIVVALLGDEATVKRLSIGENGVWLLPENPAYEPIDAREASILGRVCGLVRTF